MSPERRPMVAGNWKMNAGGPEAAALAVEVARATASETGVDVLVAPPFTALALVVKALDDVESRVLVAGQNMSAAESGAHTGEISSSMIRAVGATWVILGHSERRQLCGETDATVTQKVHAAMTRGPRPIVCVGDTLAEREAGRTLAVVGRQVRAFASELDKQPGFGVIAYEPIWAIGTGKVAEPSDAETVHAAIRAILTEVSTSLARTTRLLYGGSVKADNARAILACPNVDGVLVGGASLEARGFAAIVQAANVASK